MQLKARISTGLVGLSVALMCSAPALAQVAAPAPPAAPAVVAPDSTAWQNVIDGQISAFQMGDAPKAFGYAAAAFQKTFTDPNAFMMSIAQSGYTPIFTSVSHSFGTFTQPDANTVLQDVKLMGAKQELYDAVYALSLEADGWRVLGVQLTKSEGIGV